MHGKVNLYIGETGTGKTTNIINLIDDVKHREIFCYLKIPGDFLIPKSKLYTNFPLFLSVIETKKDSIIIIDEAWTALPEKLNISLTKPNKLDNRLAEFLVNARKLNNFVFIIYHSFHQLPRWLLDYTNFLHRFHTTDQMNYQARRFVSFPILADNLLNVPSVKFKPQILKLR